MKVLLAEKLGICPGVKNAISMAEEVLKSRIRNPESRIEVYSLGPIIHNKDVVEKLAKAGLRTVDNVEDILKTEVRRQKSEVRSEKFEIPSTVEHHVGSSGIRHAVCQYPTVVLIRSHGAAPAQIAALKKMGVNIVDATCVLVKKVQKIAEELQRDGYKVVVVGDENHPEVQAVVGCARDVVVVADESDLHKLPKNSKLGILCQTTQSPEYFSRMLGAIAQYGTAPILELSALACLKGQYPKIGAVYINTLCKEAIKRQESAVQLCKGVDIMFVLGGLESANTRRLAELCKKYNSQTFHLQNWIEFDKSILFGKNIAGVTAGASTPEWIITEFVENLEAFGPVPLETGGVDANSG